MSHRLRVFRSVNTHIDDVPEEYKLHYIARSTGKTIAIEVPKRGDLIRGRHSWDYINLVVRVDDERVDKYGKPYRLVHSVRYAQASVDKYLYGTRIRPFQWDIYCRWTIVKEYIVLDCPENMYKHLDMIDKLDDSELYYQKPEPMSD